jgi:hypothetical protein
MSFENYSFRNVNVIFGIIEFEEFADGDDIVSIDPAGPQWNKTVGGKGDVVRSQTSDNTGTCSIKLLQTSKTNKLLYAQYLTDRETQIGVAPLWVSNKETGKKHIMNNAWIQGEPVDTEGQTVPITTWIFEYDLLTTVIE